MEICNYTNSPIHASRRHRLHILKTDYDDDDDDDDDDNDDDSTSSLYFDLFL